MASLQSPDILLTTRCRQQMQLNHIGIGEVLGTLNKPKRIGTSSRFRGVTWDRNRGKWVAKYKRNQHTVNLGVFDTEEDAARAYAVAAP